MEIEAELPQIELCDSWGKINRAFDSFPPPNLSFDWEGDLTRTTWVFRGLKSVEHELEPSIERAIEPSENWAAFEPLLLAEFQSKARLYRNAYDLPQLDDRLSWLALMQHYGVPTRLLDFTYSPYLALYFALRSRGRGERDSPFVKVWAIDGEAVMRMATRIAQAAKRESGERPQRGSNTIFATEREYVLSDHEYRSDVVSRALGETGTGGAHFDRAGFAV